MQIFVTGIGVVSAIGINVPEHLESFRRQRDGMAPVSLFDTVLDVPVAEVKYSDEQLREYLGLPSGKVYSRTALLGMVAAGEAMSSAGLHDISGLRIGLISSTSVGGMDTSERFYERFKQDSSRGRLRDVVSHDCGDSTLRMARYLGVTGYVTTLSTACSSAANAIMLGARMIRHGLLDCVVAGGTDALCRFTLNGFNSLMILDKEHCRPFDESRSGLNLGEGAGYIVLQSEESLKRAPRCRLAGYANANDAYHQTASSPGGDGAFLAMKNALDNSGLRPSDIDYINVHGTGTPNNDASEGCAMKRLFGEDMPRFSSTKAFTGHTLGAAGGLEAVFSVLSLEKGLVYPNLNFKNPISALGLVPETAFLEHETIHAVMSNSFGFGGNNSTLIFRS